MACLKRSMIEKILDVYTDHESDRNGDYTYFIGEKVTTFDKRDKH
jgi:hypothetical protein